MPRVHTSPFKRTLKYRGLSIKVAENHGRKSYFVPSVGDEFHSLEAAQSAIEKHLKRRSSARGVKAGYHAKRNLPFLGTKGKAMVYPKNAKQYKKKLEED